MDAFGEFTPQKLVTNQLFGLEFCAARQDTFYPHQDYEQVDFHKKSIVYFIGWSLRNWKIAAYLQLVKNWIISTKVGQNLLFLSTFPTSLQRMQKDIKNFEFVHGLNFELIDSLKNDGTKHLLIFDDSFEKFFDSKAFADLASAGRHRGLSTIYIKHNLFQQSKLGRDVELQNTHIVLFESPRDVMQVTTFGTQLDLD